MSVGGASRVELSSEERSRVWARMSGTPVVLERPVVVVKGWRSFESNAEVLARRLRVLTGAGDGVVRTFSYRSSRGVDVIAGEIAGSLDRVFGRGTRKGGVDVVGVSMGGLVGRWMSATGMARVERLFTVVSPHRGAALARWFGFLDASTGQMAPGSAFLRELEVMEDRVPEAERPEVVTYGRLRDWWVGTGNTSLGGHEHVVVRPPWNALAHLTATRDRTIPLLIAARLRGEKGVVGGA